MLSSLNMIDFRFAKIFVQFLHVHGGGHQNDPQWLFLLLPPLFLHFAQHQHQHVGVHRPFVHFVQNDQGIVTEKCVILGLAQQNTLGLVDNFGVLAGFCFKAEFVADLKNGFAFLYWPFSYQLPNFRAHLKSNAFSQCFCGHSSGLCDGDQSILG